MSSTVFQDHSVRNFNKGHSEILSWPMCESQLTNLEETRLVSPRVGDAHGYQPPGESVYREQVEEVVNLRSQVEMGDWPEMFMRRHTGSASLSPILEQTLGLTEADPGACADTVRMDHPFDIWDLVIEPWARSMRFPYKEPAGPGIQFIDWIKNRAKAHKIIADALDKAFDVKYYFGVCRPVEYFDESVARYETPNHPECPAGHGAFCGAGAYAFEEIYAAGRVDTEAVQLATKQFANFRSFSGMHIPYSNNLGWRIGYENRK